MKRSSFLGNSIEELVSYEWFISGIGNRKIGYGICLQSGLVLQTSIIPENLMIKYYAAIATYVNSYNYGSPSINKQKHLGRFIEIINFCTSKFPEKIIQFGSSDGYTLSRFKKAGSKDVLGVEPSINACRFALENYGIKSIRGTAEDFDKKDYYDLIILTHILEHIYDPLKLLKKLRNNLKDNSHVLIEVPLWERLDKIPVGILTFEHLNYFCEITLKMLLMKSGFEIIYLTKLFDQVSYPVITVLAKPSSIDYEVKSNYKENKSLLIKYLDKERNFWPKIDQKIELSHIKNNGTWIYGAGIHAAQLLSQSQILKQISINGFIDSSPTKWGKEILGYKIIKPDSLKSIPSNSNIIISSANSENSIYDFILGIRKDLNIIRLYS